MGKFAEVVPEHLFIQIPEQVEGFYAHVGSFQSALEQAPEILKPVSVDLSANVAFRMVDNFVSEVFLESHVGHERIGVNRAACFHMSSDIGLQRVLFAIRNNHCADFAATLQHAEYGSLVFSASLSNPATMFFAVHISRSAADESFVYLNFAPVAAHLENRTVLHRKTDAVKHEPCRLLSDAKSAANLIGTDTVFAVGNHPNSDKPFVERKRRILKDSSDLDGELLARMLRFAFPHKAGRDKAHVLATASRALNSSGPAPRHQEGHAIGRVRKVDDG